MENYEKYLIGEYEVELYYMHWENKSILLYLKHFPFCKCLIV